MRNPTPRTFGSPGNRKNKAGEFDILTANKMLPLVKRISMDIAEAKTKRQSLEKELNQLDSFRKELTWEARQRRYRVMDELGHCETSIEEVSHELQQLGVSVIDDKQGRIAFPTHINNKPACFTWQAPEERVMYWNYVGEEMRRPVPADWQESVAHSKQ